MGYQPSTEAEEPDTYSRFRPEDQVKVTNVLDHMFYWQVLDPYNEDVKLIPFRGIIQKRVVRKSPDMWSIAPGEVKVIPGWSAVVMIERMFKQYIIELTDNKPRPAETKNRPITYNFSNPSQQEEIIGKIFLGVERSARGELNYTSSSPVTMPKDEAPKVEGEQSVEDLAKELGISVEPN